MDVKRRDSKGRLLFKGESQEKDGSYVYKYTDINGKRKKVTSWRLTDSDRTPAGKKDKKPLRELEREVNADLFDNISCEKMTVCELVDKYLQTKTGVKHNTLACYRTIQNNLDKEPFGKRDIKQVKLSDAKIFLIKLQADGKSYSTIHSIRGVLRPAFQMAVDDDMIRKNPFEFQLATVVVNDKVTREAITREQERQFLKFVQDDKHFSRYYEGIYILFKTGMRISEFVGLTISDIDFQNHRINIDHQLQRKRDMSYIVVSTKTNAGTRVLPMKPDVEACFKRIVENRSAPTVEPMVDGYCGFLYLDKNGNPMVALHWEHYFNRLVEKYNEIYKVQMPKITPHVCRHTYCSNMAKSGMNPKTLQYLMGHSDIGVTLNTYTHIGLEDAENELDRLYKQEKKGKIINL